MDLFLFFLLQFLFLHLHSYIITLAYSSFRSFKLKLVISYSSFIRCLYFNLLTYENDLFISSGCILFSLFDLEESMVLYLSEIPPFISWSLLFLCLICGKCSDSFILSKSDTLSSFSSNYSSFSILDLLNRLLLVRLRLLTHSDSLIDYLQDRFASDSYFFRWATDFSVSNFNLICTFSLLLSKTFFLASTDLLSFYKIDWFFYLSRCSSSC